MNIYQPLIITEQIVKSFVPSKLYIKELAGVKYFGKTSLDDVYSYTGSGTVWRKRIKKYGKENIKTLWVSDTFYCPYAIQEAALKFSIENNIVESKEWANLKPETGLDGGFFGKQSEEAKAKISKANTGVVRDDEYRAKVSKVHKGKIETAETKLKKSLAHMGNKHSAETLKKLSDNSGRAISITIDGVTYRTLYEAAAGVFPALPYYTGIRRIKKMM